MHPHVERPTVVEHRDLPRRRVRTTRRLEREIVEGECGDGERGMRADHQTAGPDVADRVAELDAW